MKNTDNAVIKIKNRQTDGSDSDVIDVCYTGRFYEKNGKYYAVYNDADNASCMIKADGSAVTVRHGGGASSSMICEAGKRCSFMYRTMYGSMRMEVKTHKADAFLDVNGGTIHLVYELYAGGGCIKNDMTIDIKVTAQ